MIAIRATTKIGVQKAQIKYIAGKTKNLTYEQVLDIIISLLNEVLELTLTDMEEWIKKYVPKRTGQLRDNLLRNIRSSRVRNGILRLIIATSIDYAAKVNEMTTAQVRHAGTDREHSGKKAYAYYWGHYGPITLDDPKAIGNFFDNLVEYAKDRVLINLAKMKHKYTIMKSASFAVAVK